MGRNKNFIKINKKKFHSTFYISFADESEWTSSSEYKCVGRNKTQTRHWLSPFSIRHRFTRSDGFFRNQMKLLELSKCDLMICKSWVLVVIFWSFCIFAVVFWYISSLCAALKNCLTITMGSTRLCAVPVVMWQMNKGVLCLWGTALGNQKLLLWSGDRTKKMSLEDFTDDFYWWWWWKWSWL